MGTVPDSALNDEVRRYWEQRTCGTGARVTDDAPRHTLEWFRRVEAHRYDTEPYIHAVAQFTRHAHERVLEIGVGAGTDHLQWARSGADCYGIDLTDAAIETTARHLSLYGLRSQLQRVDAELLPFPDAHFDLVYSWGVIHHSERPEAIVAEIRRVLRPGGAFVGMVYARHSLVVLKLWLKRALLLGRPWRSFADVVWQHMESVGTKAYTTNEVRALLTGFSQVTLRRQLTPHDTSHFPPVLRGLLPDLVGWNICFRAIM